MAGLSWLMLITIKAQDVAVAPKLTWRYMHMLFGGPVGETLVCFMIWTRHILAAVLPHVPIFAPLQEVKSIPFKQLRSANLGSMPTLEKYLQDGSVQLSSKTAMCQSIPTSLNVDPGCSPAALSTHPVIRGSSRSFHIFIVLKAERSAPVSVFAYVLRLQ